MTKEFVFVSFDPGGRGHHIARVLACLPGIHWYSHPDNGVQPWNIHSAQYSTINRRQVAPRHFDRLIDGQQLPPTWDYAQGFFPDPDQYYADVFWPRLHAVAGDIQDRLLYCTHSLPKDLVRNFDHAWIINVTIPPEQIVQRYLETTAIFPGYLRFASLVDADNPYHRFLERLQSQRAGFTVRDVWAKINYDEWYSDDMESVYRNQLLQQYTDHYKQRLQSCERTLHVSARPDWVEVKQFLGADHTSLGAVATPRT